MQEECQGSLQRQGPLVWIEEEVGVDREMNSSENPQSTGSGELGFAPVVDGTSLHFHVQSSLLQCGPRLAIASHFLSLSPSPVKDEIRFIRVMQTEVGNTFRNGKSNPLVIC